MRKILGLTRSDHIRNVDILEELAIDRDIIEILRTRRLSYFGHVARMGCHRYPRILLHGYVYGARARGPPRKKWTDNIKEGCNLLHLSLIDANRLANDRTCWRSLIGTQSWSCRSVVTRHHRRGIKSSKSSHCPTHYVTACRLYVFSENIPIR